MLGAAEAFKKEFYFQNIEIIKSPFWYWWRKIFGYGKSRNISFNILINRNSLEEIQFWLNENCQSNAIVMLNHIQRIGYNPNITYKVSIFFNVKKDLMLAKLYFNSNS